jgi:putative protease
VIKYFTASFVEKEGEKMQKDVELLAPAGSYEAFIAAVENGANAVYLGGKLFNARANASNFDLDELRKIVEYAHLRDVKIHLTLNTLLDNSEIKEALDFAYDIYSIGVDAVIVQDLGLAKVLHEHIPSLELHASTQLSTHNLEGVNELKKLGFKRVVLARELSIEEIKYIVDNTDIDIEIFSHGAQCVCYSGECLFSSMIGDRSGNRGKCAQPCRMPYELIKKSNGKESSCGKGYLLSPKDLSTLEILKEIPNVKCLKIEGRMKSPEYVATVVSIYRKYLDDLSSTPSFEDKENLKQIFNRGGFSQAYLKGKYGKDTMCYEKPKNWGLYIGKVEKYDGKSRVIISNESNIDLQIGDGIEIWNGENESPSCIISSLTKTKSGFELSKISGKISKDDKVYRTSSKALNAKARESFSRGFVRHKTINAMLIIEKESPIKVRFDDLEFTSSIVAEPALKVPITKETIEEQFRKTGSTPFAFENLEITLDEGLFLPVSKINELRRDALAYLEQSLNSKNNKGANKTVLKTFDKVSKESASKKVSAYFETLSEDILSLNSIDNYYFNFKEALKNLELIKRISGKKYVVFPLVTKGNYERIIKENIDKIAPLVDGFVISNIGQLEYIHGGELVANYTMNVFNSYTISLLKSLGFSKVILSPELTKTQTNDICKNFNSSDIKIETLAYGNVCVMTSEYCPVGSVAGGFCKDKKCSMPCAKNDKYYLKDRMNMEFSVVPDNTNCQSRIFNSKINSIETASLYVDSMMIYFLDEDISEMQSIIDTHKNGQKLSGDKYTNGHFNRPV